MIKVPTLNDGSGLRVKQKFMWQQWRKVNNYIRSVETHRDMSPDLSIRQQVNDSLQQQRPPLSAKAWCDECRQITQSQPQTLLFIYHSLEAYSGIEFNRVRPHDRLVDDLQFPMVCWFDWSVSFCNDVKNHFGIDISDCFDETSFDTVAELITFLDGCLVVSDNAD
ncbi:MAG: hypothetical protein KTR27_06215 [Leptolyngbyaceae cyanobacterium MAG.088]|nr:hypothetical protein [Leptolyngbyaceae cyanobacterium MAG.088]